MDIPVAPGKQDSRRQGRADGPLFGCSFSGDRQGPLPAAHQDFDADAESRYLTVRFWPATNAVDWSVRLSQYPRPRDEDHMRSGKSTVLIRV